MSAVKVTVLPNGPLKVEGDVEVKDAAFRAELAATLAARGYACRKYREQYDRPGDTRSYHADADVAAALGRATYACDDATIDTEDYWFTKTPELFPPFNRAPQPTAAPGTLIS